MSTELQSRRTATLSRVEEIKHQVQDSSARARGKACVYATGSYGRREAGQHSDLDVFIVGINSEIEDFKRMKKSALSRLSEICIKAEMIHAASKLKIPEFDGDGRFFSHYSVDQFVKTLGHPEDDVTNTFTARLLMLLESFPIIESDVYDTVIGDVIAAYWRDYEDHSADFMPAFLANDILRLWRTFCINYEARTDRKTTESKAKGKVKSYKLKHSRLLTCYSGLIYLLARFKLYKTVTPDAAFEMVSLSPTERFERLAQEKPLKIAREVSDLLKRYDEFLSVTKIGEKALVQQFMDPEEAKALIDRANEFGDGVFAILKKVGMDNRFYRLIVV